MAWLLTRPPHNDNGKNMQSALLTIRDLKKSYLISSSLFANKLAAASGRPWPGQLSPSAQVCMVF